MSLTRREAAARLMEHLVTHSAHGYSQPARQGRGTEQVSLGDGVTVTVAGGDRDCSSAIISALKAVGINTGSATYTGNMRAQLAANGPFDWRQGTSGMVRGDILLNETHHTAMYLGNGKVAEFSISETGGVSGREGDQTGWESHIRGMYTYSKGWDGYLHWLNDGGTIDGAEDNVGGNNSSGNSGGKLLLDCDAGKLTIAEWARQLSLSGDAADGYINHQYAGNKPYLKNVSSVIYAYDGTPSPFAQALQRRVGSANVDGILGKVDVKNVQRYMNVSWGYHMLIDGICGPTTAYNVQHSLNLGLWAK